MSISMYHASIPVYQSMLNGLSFVLAKGEQNAKERDIEADVFLTARHAPDMLPLLRQVQIASDLAKGGASRLAGVDLPSWEDNESNFADLQARIKKTIEFVSGISEGDLEGAESREIKMSVGGQDMEFDGRTFLFHFNLPNFYFHVATTYTILRSQGVPLGKRNYFGRD